MDNTRLRCSQLEGKVMSAEDAAKMIQDQMVIGVSGFTPAGYPKAVPLALAKRAENGDNVGITLITGASVGPELDGALAKAGVIKRRFPYQTNSDLRNSINDGNIKYQDMHLSHVSQFVEYGFMGKMDFAIVEAVAINADGGIVPSTSVGNSATFVQYAKKVIVEINSSQPLSLEGVHDIYLPKKPPHREPLPLVEASQRIGTTYIPCDPSKIAAVVFTDIPDATRPVAAIDEVSKKMAANLIAFLEKEVQEGRLPKNLLPLQSGVGSVANAVLGGLNDSKFENLEVYSEVLQDSALDLLASGKVKFASGTSITLSPEALPKFYEEFENYKDKIVLRPQEISNSPEIARRIGVISLNTAIECDIYGNVNSTHIMGSRMMNGIGGSGDFTRNAYLSVFTTESIAKGGAISSIVPMVSHHDHTEHDVMVIVTEQGVADLRGLNPQERAEAIIENCAHPDYKQQLRDYFERAKAGKFQHTPHLLNEALSWHQKFVETGSMK